MPGIYRYIRPNVLIGRLGLGQVGHRHVGTSLTLELLQRIGRNLFIHLPAAQDVYRHVDRIAHRLLVGFVLPGDIETHPVRGARPDVKFTPSGDSALNGASPWS